MYLPREYCYTYTYDSQGNYLTQIEYHVYGKKRESKGHRTRNRVLLKVFAQKYILRTKKYESDLFYGAYVLKLIILYLPKR